MELFKDESGKLSSTRVFGALCVIFSIVLACCKMVKEAQALVSAGVTLLSAGQGKSALVNVANNLTNKHSIDQNKSTGKEEKKDEVKVQEDI